jgi:predicted ATPase/DNA-binding SARP family transcriptional activator
MESSTQLAYRLLGPVEVRRGEESLPLGAAKQRAVLTILLINERRPVTSDALVEALWPETMPGRPQTAIQGYVSQLRKILEPEHEPSDAFSTIVTEGAGYRLAAAPEQVDVTEFERLLQAGRQARAAEQPHEAVGLLRTALALWRGPALAEFRYEGWAQAEIARLEELRLVAVEELLEAQLAAGENAALVGELESLVTEHPLRERFRAQLMLGLYRSGRQVEALEAYQETRRALVDEVGIEPGAELQALNRAILNQDPSLTIAPAAQRRIETNLPEPPTPFIGRARELAELRELVLEEHVRLLTLTGPGGTGKTRLALELAGSLADEFPAGVFFVELASITDEDLLVPAIAQAVGVREQPGEQLDRTLAVRLSERAILLVLDNFEQLLQAGPRLAKLLLRCPEPKILVTSRAALRLAAEHEFPVPPLAVPDPLQLPELSGLSRYEAVRLFIDRSRAVRPGFQVTDQTARAVAEICVRLDGLPLAIELAAARSKLLPPNALVRRLDERLKLLTGGSRDLPARQQTLRGAIEWSYELLSEEERALFGRLAVFVGGCTIDAAVAVCGFAGELDVFEGLASLVDKSLLRQLDAGDSEPRFGMLETIREYALDCLKSMEEKEEIERRQAEYFLALAEEGEPELTGSGQLAWLARLEAELPNIRAALIWAGSAGETTIELRLAGALHVLWHLHGHWSEGRYWLEEALESSAGEPPELRDKALRAAGNLARRQGHWEPAASFSQQRLELHRATGNPAGVASALIDLGALALDRGDYTLSTSLHEESLAQSRAVDYTRGVAISLHNLGYLELIQGNHERAEEISREALDWDRRLGDSWHIATTLLNLGFALLEQNRLDESAARLAESLALLSKLGDKQQIAYGLLGFGALAVRRGDAESAARLIAASDHALGVVAGRSEPFEAGLRARTLEAAQARGKALGDLDEGAGRVMGIEEAIAFALDRAPEQAASS